MRDEDWNTIQTEVLRELGEGSVTITGDITRNRTDVLRDIAAYYPWKWLEQVPLTLTTDSGQTYITKPSYLGDIAGIYQSSAGGEIEYITPSEYARRMASLSTAKAKVPYYTEQGGRILPWPPLEDGSSVFLLGSINVDLVDRDDTNAIDGIKTKIPNHFIHVVVDGILAILDSDKAMKAFWEGRFNRRIEVKKAREVAEKGQRIRPLKDTVMEMSRRYTSGG